MSGVQVVAGGNPRQGAMDVDERDQCIRGTIETVRGPTGFNVWGLKFAVGELCRYRKLVPAQSRSGGCSREECG